jgi:hypothetical protein
MNGRLLRFGLHGAGVSNTRQRHSAVEGERENSCDDGHAGERDYDFDHAASLRRNLLTRDEHP